MCYLRISWAGWLWSKGFLSAFLSTLDGFGHENNVQTLALELESNDGRLGLLCQGFY